MVDPVVAGDTYDRLPMQHWLQHDHTSPVTGAPLPHTRLIPNFAIKSAMQASATSQLLSP